MEDGIYNDISIKDYHLNRTHLSATSIKLAKKSLALWRWSQDHPQESKSHFDFGNAFELALFDKVGFSTDVAILPTKEWQGKALESNPKLVKPTASKFYKELEEGFIGQNTGKYLISDVGEQSYSTIECMLESCYRDAIIQKLIAETQYQLSLFWTDEATGLRLKTRPDICKVKKNVIVNLKTTEDGSPAAFSKQLAKFDYPLQACIEIRGCQESGLMEEVENYFWLVVEKNPPYNATIYEFAPADIPACMDNLDFVLSRIKKAKDENKYPGYTDFADNQWGILKAEIPLWYKMNS